MRNLLNLFAVLSLIAFLTASPAKAVVITLDADSNVSGTDPGVTLVGAWSQSNSTAGFIGTGYLQDGNTGGGKSVTYTPTIPSAGMYLVEARWTGGANRASNTPFDINFDGGSTTIPINQEANGGVWNSLGIFNFAAGTAGNVKIRNDGANEFVIADGVRFTTFVPLPAGGIASDDFENYVAPSNLNGGASGVGFNSNWATTSTNVSVQPKMMMDPNNLVNGGVQAVRIQPAANIAGDDNSIVSRTFAPVTDTVYVGMLLRAESFGAGGDFINFQLTNGAAGNNAETLGFGISNVGGQFFTRVGGSSSPGDTDLGPLVVLNQDYLVVAKFSLDGNGQYGQVELYINPTSLIEPMAPDLISVSTQPSITQLSRFNVRVNSLETTDVVFFDQLRISSTFAGAITATLPVPEPASLSLLALSSLSLLRRRRR